VITEKPPDQNEEEKDTALARVAEQVFARFKPGERVTYSPELGAEGTFYRFRKHAAKSGRLVFSGSSYFVPLPPPEGLTCGSIPA
jgi:hypothetical protein